jgi:23S rRNA (cytidine1920-2'-O)/16S rRNA (cytidine1409-2'-O)-methyltransferase
MEKKLKKIRLDQLLVERGLVENPSKARARIMAGDVIVNEHRADKAGDKFAPDADIRLRGNSHPFVSRGGLKLEHALKLWPITVKDAVCIDIGASTGGFSEVLLLHGAEKVYAVDVGYGQLAEKLRTEKRLVNLERTHILDLSADKLEPRPEIAVIDLSFISLRRILPHVLSLLSKNAHIIALIKPQFEAGRESIAKGGIVKDENARARVCAEIIDFAKSLGLEVRGISESPITGAKGNVEYLISLLVV